MAMDQKTTSSFDAEAGRREALSAVGFGQAEQQEVAQVAAPNYGSDSPSPQANAPGPQVRRGTKLYHHDMHIPTKFLQASQSSAVDTIVDYLS